MQDVHHERRQYHMCVGPESLTQHGTFLRYPVRTVRRQRLGHGVIKTVET